MVGADEIEASCSYPRSSRSDPGVLNIGFLHSRFWQPRPGPTTALLTPGGGLRGSFLGGCNDVKLKHVHKSQMILELDKLQLEPSDPLTTSSLHTVWYFPETRQTFQHGWNGGNATLVWFVKKQQLTVILLSSKLISIWFRRLSNFWGKRTLRASITSRGLPHALKSFPGNRQGGSDFNVGCWASRQSGINLN